MRRALVLLAACGTTKPLPPVQEMTVEHWIERCSARLEVARIAVAHVDKSFAKAKVSVTARPHIVHIRVHLDVAPDGYFTAGVQHGAECLGNDPDEPADWHDAGHGMRIVLYRARKLGKDRAHVEGNRVSPDTAKSFRREMERALDACLLEARGVAMAKAPC